MADESIVKFLRETAPKNFVPHAYYSHEGDSLFFFYADPSRYFAERIDDFLTVYRSVDIGNQLVGCQVKGVPRALELFGSFGLEIEDGFVKVSMIFLACMAATASEEEIKKFYIQLGEAAKNTKIAREELPCANRETCQID